MIRNVFHKRLALLLIPALLMASLALGFSSTEASASTAPQCSSPGSLRESLPAYYGSTVLGYLQVYYNSSNGYNCARFLSVGAASGVAKLMNVSITRCQNTSPSSTCTPPHTVMVDTGTYSYYAGYVGVYSPNNCISAYGSLMWKGQNVDAWMSGASHC